ncbi:MAG TPA: hypothetical protein VGV60_16230 [Candidatus Polarisedimenticolia bacterium]|jgi:hypothetical protein|nr:hypothetical protein [Candidatus Polarisedimenticolia bacterium]
MIRVPVRHVIQLLPIVLATVTTVSADVIMKMKVEADVISFPAKGSSSNPCQVPLPTFRTGDNLVLTLGTDRVRLDGPAVSVILRLDQRRLSFVFPGDKKYAYLKLPIAYQKYRSGFQKMAGPDLLQFRLETLTGPESTSGLGRPAVKYSATLANGMRSRWRATFVLTKDFPADPGPAVALRMALHNLRFSGGGWLDLLPLAGGLPLLWEEAERQPETEFKYREETVEIEQRDVAPGTYDVPASYTRLDYDRDCMLVRY